MVSPGRHHHWLEVARSVQQEADAAGVGRLPRELASDYRGPRTVLERFEEAVTSIPLRSVSHQLFADGHYARAVEEAFKCLNNTVKSKSGLNNKDGADLMWAAFSANSPILKLNTFQSESEKDEQRGYMEIFAGAMRGIRNPRAHEHELVDEPEVALELLVWANHLMRKLEGTVRNAMTPAETGTL